MEKVFAMIDLRRMQHFIGFEVRQDKCGILIHEHKYVRYFVNIWHG